MATFSWELFEQFPAIGILRGYTVAETVEASQAAVKGGLLNVEVTMNTESACECISAMVSELGKGVNIGAGTVCNMSDLEKAISAGAKFIVTPILSMEVITECRRLHIPIICGALTPTEVYQAWDAGADMVKVFPIDVVGGPKYIKALKGPLDKIRLVPTGGVDLRTIVEYVEAGAFGFGIGSPIFNREKILADDWEWLIRHTEKLRSTYQKSVKDSAP